LEKAGFGHLCIFCFLNSHFVLQQLIAMTCQHTVRHLESYQAEATHPTRPPTKTPGSSRDFVSRTHVTARPHANIPPRIVVLWNEDNRCGCIEDAPLRRGGVGGNVVSLPGCSAASVRHGWQTPYQRPTFPCCELGKILFCWWTACREVECHHNGTSLYRASVVWLLELRQRLKSLWDFSCAFCRCPHISNVYCWH
jgi:hypothetical protein